MLFYSKCKINLGLFITSKHEDGFHNLESIFYPIDWNDAIEIELNPNSKTKVELIEYNNSATSNPSENLCVKAYNLLDSIFNLPPVKIHLLKTIPTGAGLGGGSSNASTTLKLLNEFFNLKIANSHLKEYASQLGSDCPFFVDNKPAFVQGRGEIIKSIELDLSNYSILLINPGIHISTANAFATIVPKEIEFDLESKIITSEVVDWKNFLVNDFEKAAIKNYPIIGEIKNEMYSKGALYSSMSGSGSTVFGIFDDYKKAEEVQKKYSQFKSKLVYSKNYHNFF